MAQDLTPSAGRVPDHLRHLRKTTRIGNIDSSDVIIPRIKLLQGISPEVTEVEGARAGEFWHTISQASMGKSLLGVPILLRKTYVLWAPRGDDRGILARSRDAIKWDPPEGSFTVRFKGNPNPYVWTLAPTVAESRLDQFGTSRPGDAQSPPAASLTYECIWYFPDMPEMSPAIILNTRGSIKQCQRFISMTEAKPVDHFYQLYHINVFVDKGPNGENFYNYAYQGAGYTDEQLGELTSSLYEKYEKLKMTIRANEEGDDEPAPPSNGARQTATEPSPTARTADTKF